MIIEVGITYLEMTNRSQLNPRRSDVDGLEIKRAELPLPEFNRFLYTAVGGDWYWVDRLNWTKEKTTLRFRNSVWSIRPSVQASAPIC